jgi:hypothetical protein
MLSAVACASASALEWLLNGKGIAAPFPVKSSGTLTFADLVAGTTLECAVTGESTIGPTFRDLTKLLTTTECKFVKQGSCEVESKFPPTVSDLNFPYLTLILLKGNGKFTDQHEPDNAGNPGWLVRCGVGGILKVDDECTSPLSNTLPVNTAGGVVQEFLESEAYSCTLGNATSGMITGRLLEENPKGGTISIGEG